jgi:hypothetical protein
MGVSGGSRPVTDVKAIARECGFELAGIAAARPLDGEMRWYREWIARGYAGRMSYLAGHRAEVRADPRRLLGSARSILCVGKLYNTGLPYSTAFDEPGRAWISRYAWGEDYHEVMRRALRALVARLARESRAPFDWKICVDTAPLLERSYARLAGLGWIGKNSCLIHQGAGSWFFLGAVLRSRELPPTPRRRHAAAVAGAVWMPAPPERSSPPGRRTGRLGPSTRAAASRISRSNCMIRRPKDFEGRWAGTFLAVTSARRCAPGTEGPR